MKHVTLIVARMMPLREDLKNIGEFFAMVLRMADALELHDDPIEYPGLTDLIVRKMGVAQRLDWLRVLGNWKATVQVFKDYVGDLHRSLKRVQDLTETAGSSSSHPGGTKTGTKPKPRIMLHEGLPREGRPKPYTKGVNSRRPEKCVLNCGNAHQLGDCGRFKNMSVSERWGT